MNVRAAGSLLIVDDDRPLGAMLGWAFEDLGYAVTVTRSCREALDQARDRCFDFALLDYGLPDGDGHALAIRLTARQPGLAVIMMSADRAGALAGIGGTPAARALLQKPLSPIQADALFRDDAQADRLPSPA